MRYESIEPVSRETAERVAGGTAADELANVILAVALHEEDGAWAEQYCRRLADHAIVRGASLLGFGHLARRFRCLNRVQVEPLLRAGLADGNAWVRGQAEAAVDDVELFLGWQAERM